MKTLKIIFTASIIMTCLIIMTTTAQQAQKWEAPKWADTLKNPLKNNTEATVNGKMIYNKMCAACHGDKGKGDGVAGISLNPKPADHTSAKIQGLTDGALYWMITNGKPPMPAYKAILKDTERWILLNYIRELGKAATSKTKK